MCWCVELCAGVETGKEDNNNHFVLLVISGKNIKKKERLGNAGFIYTYLYLSFHRFPIK